MARAPAVKVADDIPEIDRLDEFPHPRATERLFGHDEAERKIADAFGSGHMHHGWLLTGPEGVGKATFAYRVARHVLSDPASRDGTGGCLTVPWDSSAARQVRALSHPGLLVIRRGYDLKTKRIPATIPVDEVRRLKGFLALASEAGSWRAVIVDRADELNVNAANALLKSLEEPPPRTIFLLISSAPARLLPTIRSRVRTLELAPLVAGLLKLAVTQAIVGADDSGIAPPTPSEWTALERLASGSVRRALALHAGRGLELHARLSQLLGALPEVDWVAVHALSDDLASPASESRFELFYALLMGELSRVIHARATGDDSDAQGARAAKLIGEGRLASWAAMWETIAADKADAMALNLDRKALILDIFFRLAAAARPEP